MKVNREDVVRELIRDFLKESASNIKLEISEIDNDEDIYKSGIIDSYGVVELMVLLEEKTGTAADLFEGQDESKDNILTVNRLVNLFCRDQIQ